MIRHNVPPEVALLLDAWREVGRHLEIAESIAGLAPRMREVLTVTHVVVRRLRDAPGGIETVASVPAIEAEGRTAVDSRGLTSVRTWALQGRVAVLASPAGPPGLAVPAGLAGPLVVGPLVSEGVVLGVLIATGRPDPAVIQALLEPLAAALANDRRLHELARLREAALADNRALLSRLERQDITGGIVGRDRGLREVMARVEQVAPTDVPVLVLGETGAGKEVVARAIHERSPRRAGPVLRVNCGAIPPELVDSELFGHERGSFTGAINTRKGWFERADGGTLFLDEIAELPAAAQVRLLRVLQDGTFERVGGQRTLAADVRIVAATHRDLKAMTAAGTFREDLWYRVSVFPIVLPPLRERREDIGALAAHFAARAGLRLHGVALAPTPEDIRRLSAYDWPGNVRELAAVIERAAILGGGRGLDLTTALGAATLAPEPEESTLEAANRRAIEDALHQARGRVEGPRGAARILGINASTLRSRMRRLGISWETFRED